ncbi:conserved membrane hypothetical protein [[Clostridium] ultunense Esp]|nr:conserved membrane hypothetical protein [[Clostridium] ultunense Esp]
MKLLVLVHVLSAIIGVGPTFFGHVLMRNNQSVESLRQSMAVGKYLEYFPKIGGTIAVLSGLILAVFGNYGSFLQIWLIGSLILYVYIQIVVIGFVAPTNRKLASWIFDPQNIGATVLPEEIRKQYSRANRFYWAASIGGLLLFILMILKPSFQLY